MPVEKPRDDQTQAQQPKEETEKTAPVQDAVDNNAPAPDPLREPKAKKRPAPARRRALPDIMPRENDEAHGPGIAEDRQPRDEKGTEGSGPSLDDDPPVPDSRPEPPEKGAVPKENPSRKSGSDPRARRIYKKVIYLRRPTGRPGTQHTRAKPEPEPVQEPESSTDGDSEDSSDSSVDSESDTQDPETPVKNKNPKKVRFSMDADRVPQNPNMYDTFTFL